MTAQSPIRFQDEQLLARHILRFASERSRTLVGIAGAPGSGKSTLGRHLRDALCHIAQRPGLATVVPMDGFHLSNAELQDRGLDDRKGSPDTFRPRSLFVRLLEIKRCNRLVLMPLYSRELHEPVPDALEVRPETPIVLVEGNYLLCDFGLWSSVAGLFDLKIFVVTSAESTRQRVIERHVQGGLSPEEAAARYAQNDAPNAEIAARGEQIADILYEN